MTGRGLAAPERSQALDSRRRPFAAALLALAAVLGLAAGLRLLQVHESLWLDELHTAWTVCDGWGQITSRAGLGNHPPTYFFMAWVSVQALGLSEYALRLPSAVAGVALVVLASVAVQRLVPNKSGSRCQRALV